MSPYILARALALPLIMVHTSLCLFLLLIVAAPSYMVGLGLSSFQKGRVWCRRLGLCWASWLGTQTNRRK